MNHRIWGIPVFGQPYFLDLSMVQKSIRFSEVLTQFMTFFSVSILAFRVGTVTAMSVLQRFCRVSEERKELGTANCIPFAPNLIDNEVIIRANNSKCNIMRLSENWYHSS